MMGEASVDPAATRLSVAPTAKLNDLDVRAISGIADQHRCPDALSVASLLQRAATRDRRLAAIVADAANLLLAAELIRRGVDVNMSRHAGGLARWQLERVIAAMDAALADSEMGERLPFRLADLAAVVNLSPAHFCTAFRQSTGLPPHAWMRRRRLERAIAMLDDATLSLTDIALACGYGSSSHFSTAFRKQTGMTPTAWRRR